MAVARGTALPYPLPPGLKADPDPEPEPSAVTLTAAELAEATSMPAADAARLLPVASRAVLDYAPQAPVEMLNEAVIRYAGYLHGSDFGGVKSETTGPLSIEYQMNHAAAFRNSGAAALLTRHKRRRAGSIG